MKRLGFAASISVAEVECVSSCAAGAQVVGEELTVTDTLGPFVLTFDGVDASERFRMESADELASEAEATILFPYVYSEKGDVPALSGCFTDKCPADFFPPDDPAYRGIYESHPEIDPYAVRPLLKFNHSVDIGAKLKRAFIYDRNIIMENRGLVPGKDIMVVGFDNTHMSEDMLPPLSSIGTDTQGLGHRAAQIMLNMMNGQKACSEVVRTKLYGRESLVYETNEYTTQELEIADPGFICRMFDDCFYRYSSSNISREQINLREQRERGP